MTRVVGLLPLSAPQMTHVVLGSLPGQASLAAHQYYAHPRNLFWPFMTELWQVPAAASYAHRVSTLAANGVGVWDVLAAAHRHGSLDAAIKAPQPNELVAWLSGHPLVAIGLNGTTAAQLFRRYCQPALAAGGVLDHVTIVQLPSTSPANAAQRRANKLAAWRNFSSLSFCH